MADARDLLKSISEVAVHSKTAETKQKGKSVAPSARRAGNHSSGDEGKGKGKRKNKDFSKTNPKAKNHSTAWTRHVAKDDDLVAGKKRCEHKVWTDLHGWERHSIIVAGRKLKEANHKAANDKTDAKLDEIRQASKQEIADLKRKISQLEDQAARKEKVRRSKSAFKTNLTDEFGSESE